MLGPLLNKTFCDDSVLVKILFQDLMQLKMILHLDQFWPDKCALPTYLPTYLPMPIRLHYTYLGPNLLRKFPAKIYTKFAISLLIG